MHVFASFLETRHTSRQVNSFVGVLEVEHKRRTCGSMMRLVDIKNTIVIIWRLVYETIPKSNANGIYEVKMEVAFSCYAKHVYICFLEINLLLNKSLIFSSVF